MPRLDGGAYNIDTNRNIIMSKPDFGHKARKRFGQNFLTDPGIINKIVRSITPKTNDNIVEIGPGQGAITGQILELCPRLNVVELDRDLIPILLTQFAIYPGFKIHQADALKFDFEQLCQAETPLRIIGNLPYNISTPLIFHLLGYQDKIKDMHFMLQKEVVERMASEPGKKSYGRLTIMVQYYCKVENLFPVAPECFNPRPKVDSAIVRLQPYSEFPVKAKNVALMEKIVNAAFQQRRKTLRNTLKQFISAEQMASLTINTGLRPENLSVADYAQLSDEMDAFDV